MAITTIKVDVVVRDQLAELARTNGRTLGQQVAALIEQARPTPMWDEFAADYQRLITASRAWADDLGLHPSEPASAEDEAKDGVYRGQHPVRSTDPTPPSDPLPQRSPLITRQR